MTARGGGSAAAGGGGGGGDAGSQGGEFLNRDVVIKWTQSPVDSRVVRLRRQEQTSPKGLFMERC